MAHSRNVDCSNSLLEPGVIEIPDSFGGYPSNTFLIPAHYKDDIEYVLIPSGLLKDRVHKLAADILSLFPAGEPLLVICLLKSALGFFTALMESLKLLNREVDGRSSRILFSEFVRVRSYVNDKSSGEVEVSGVSDSRLASAITDQNVLIVDDMIDTGRTMRKILETLKDFSPRNLKVATMLRKRCPESTGYIPDFLGFDIPNRFVVGFYIDYNQYFRDLEHLCVVNEHGKKKYALKN